MSARLTELVVFAFLLPLCVGGLLLAIRKDRTWIAAALVGIAACIVTIAVNLRGYAIAGAPAYGIDHRHARAHTSAGDVLLALVAAAVSIVLCLLIRRRSKGAR